MAARKTGAVTDMAPGLERAIAAALAPGLDEPEFTEFVELLERADPLVKERAERTPPEVIALRDRLRLLQFERTQRELVEKDEDPERVARALILIKADRRFGQFCSTSI